jgi:hypothetical protein
MVHREKDTVDLLIIAVMILASMGLSSMRRIEKGREGAPELSDGLGVGRGGRGSRSRLRGRVRARTSRARVPGEVG